MEQCLTDNTKRASKYSRRKATQNVHLSERDLYIIYKIFENRFLTTTHIIKLLNLGSDGAVNRQKNRLRALYDSGYLDRPERQHKFVVGGGSKAIVYAIGDKGADLLSQQPFNVPRAKVEWRAKNRSVKSPFMDHTLLVATVMVELEVACARRGDMRVVSEREIIDEQSTPAHKKVRNRRSIPVKVRDLKGRVHQKFLIPDKIFALEHEPTGKRKYLFLEADRGTEPLTARIERSSILLKMQMYDQIAYETLQDVHFGIKDFGVLFVTQGVKRAENMVGTNKKVRNGKGWKRFLFTTEGAVKKDGILTLGWWNGRDDELISLVKK